MAIHQRKPKTCIDCGNAFLGSTTAKRCPTCQEIERERQLVKSNERQKQRRRTR